MWSRVARWRCARCSRAVCGASTGDGAGHPSRVYPWIVDPEENKIVSIDPRRAFGRPTIADRSLTVEVIADRFKAGDSIDLLVKDYKLSKDQVEVALRWGMHGAAAA